MTYWEFKKCFGDTYDSLPMESILTQALLEKRLDVNEILSAYTKALEYERHKEHSKFEEACTCLCQYLSGNFTKEEHKSEMDKRMVHIYNQTEFLPSHIYDSEYNYDKDDEKKWDDFCKNTYGIKFND